MVKEVDRLYCRVEVTSFLVPMPSNAARVFYFDKTLSSLLTAEEAFRTVEKVRLLVFER
jgi:hypothetical protein